jgi:hypothetical protein
MNVCSVQEAKSRFYFISAREVLEHRLTRKQQMTNREFLLDLLFLSFIFVSKYVLAYQASGFMVRLQEFENFEDNFEVSVNLRLILNKYNISFRNASQNRQSRQSLRRTIVGQMKL